MKNKIWEWPGNEATETLQYCYDCYISGSVPESHSLVTTPTHYPVSDLLTVCKDGGVSNQKQEGLYKNEAKGVMQATKVSDSLLPQSKSCFQHYVDYGN